ncbi:ParM/StbA family protein [Nodularia spumigena CS-591/04]|uniref:ParM/StbA family protein n=1 Tax=Nodularia spumigena TaxID=70799 RepID=UPI0023308429|nr:ParM/StbA family protein [Nodularia spumigena]MDB9324077.1 ParM/StbA family protein [Nodularia spumigena CS-591/07A]MDB9329654.1 ParM/StbA family protein [Nodularia spumigena CS-591/04]MDB9361046.1 ParM/StbA family protein [Nodularia spumigena CS-588/02]MDB9364043.1 ParM/StbA family protein [Nodularia spumigena CS-588/02A10]
MNTPKSPAANPLNTKNILSVDLGKLYTKACISRNPDNVVVIPSHVQYIGFSQIFSGAMYKYQAISNNPLINIWLEYKGSGYAVGQLAAKFGANLGFGQSKVDDALVKVLAAAGHFKLKDEISVVISLPFFYPAQFEKEKLELTSLLFGPHVMNFRGESVYLNITKVWVIPDGLCSLLWTKTKSNKGFSIPDFTKIPVGIVDIGYQNINFITVDNFQWVKDTSEIEDFGMNKFYEIIAAEIDGADSQSLGLICAVNKPKGERFYRPKSASKPTNLDDFLPNITEMFSRDICYLVFDWLPEGVTDIIITGGGGEFFWEEIQPRFKEARINAYLAAPSRQANVLGQYIYIEALLSAVRAVR